MQLLTEMKDNTVCTIKWMFGLSDETEEALRGWEIHPGSEIRVICNDGSGLMIIGAGEKRIALNAETSGHIRV